MGEVVKVSVIIPVYNKQKHLTQCLDSICVQTLKEIEILCIDDGSTDSSPEILEEYRQRDERLRVFRQENGGVAAARNAGLKRAQGEYLICWDADDFVEPDALEKLYDRATADQADICVNDVSVFFEDKGEEVAGSGYLKMSRVPAELPFNMQSNPEHVLDFTNGVIANKMFRRNFLSKYGLCFLPFSTGEDTNLVVKALCLAERITVVNEHLYHYRRSQPDSLSARWYEHTEDPILAWVEAAEFLRERDRLPERSFSNRAWSYLLSMLTRSSTSWLALKATVETMKNGSLERMGVVEREDGYYYEQWKADCLHHVLNDLPEDFLCYFLYTVNGQLREERIVNREQRKEWKARIKRLETEKENLLNSKEYKLGKAMLSVPRGIQRKMKKP